MSGVSLKPSDAVAGGGPLDDQDVNILSVRFRSWDYNGQLQTPILGMEVKFQTDDGSLKDQVYSAGDMKHFVPSEDGRQAVPVGNHTGLNENTNAIAFITSLVNSGFDESKIGDDVSVFDGTRVHVNALPQPKRPGVKGDDKNKTILLVTKLIAMPGENVQAAAPANKKAAAPKTAAPKATQAPVASAAQATPASAPAPTGDIAERTTQVVCAILAEKGGAVLKSALANTVFQKVAKDVNRNAIVQTAFNDAFLKAGPWEFDGTTIKMDAAMAAAMAG